MPTGDGIQRVTTSESLLAPSGGEGGSVPQALGSKAEERAKRRKAKKDSYAKYLESSTWRKIRAKALARDKHKCRACGEKAQHVHHIRYPKNLGEEKMDWLYSLCVPCHEAVHRAATTMTLRAATDLILGATREGKVTRLPDAGRRQMLRTRKNPPGKKSKKQKRKIRVRPAHIKDTKNKKQKLIDANEELHATFAANRERRERRWSA